MTFLDEVAQSNPDAWWWLKANGCDITKGLKESVKLQWSSDVDLNDGYLQEQYDRYKKRLELAEKAGLQRDKVGNDLNELLEDLVKDFNFIHSGKSFIFDVKINMHVLYMLLAELKSSNHTYSEKMQSGKCKDKDLITLSWKIKELSELNEIGIKLHAEIKALSTRIEDHHSLWEQENIPRCLKDIRKNMVSFIKGVTCHQRTAATHILVFMISNEERRKNLMRYLYSAYPTRV